MVHQMIFPFVDLVAIDNFGITVRKEVEINRVCNSQLVLVFYAANYKYVLYVQQLLVHQSKRCRSQDNQEGLRLIICSSI